MFEIQFLRFVSDPSFKFKAKHTLLGKKHDKINLSTQLIMSIVISGNLHM